MFTRSHRSEVKVTEPAAAPGRETATEVHHPAADDGHAMIAEAAYYAAERRGFAPGLEVQDWLAAELSLHQKRSHKSQR